MNKLVGTVLWFNDKTGFGFIEADNDQYFVHFKSIKMHGYKTLKPFQIVSFIPEKGDKGIFATNVECLNDEWRS